MRTKLILISTVYYRDTFIPLDYLGLIALDSVKESKWYPISEPTYDDLDMIVNEFEKENPDYHYDDVRVITE